MQSDGSHTTAYRVALRRAAHQVLDHPTVFDDPLAVTILGPEARAQIHTTPLNLDPRRRAFMAARSRYAEDQLARAIDRGVRQYVVLGAGLDTYAYRSHPEVRVFEVDHPAVQAWKRSRLQQSGIAIPDSMAFVPVDFERQSLDQMLEANGFRLDQPAFFSCLGVIMYLTMDALTSTLRFIAARPCGSGVAFDYTLAPEAMSPSMRARQSMVATAVARLGEPFQSSFVPADLERLLLQLGFRDLDDLGPAEIDRRYFAHRDDGLRIGNGWAHVASAWV